MARNGMVATSQPLAAEAGLDILRRGGNAIDAAVAASAVLSVVEPMNVGPGGDLFAVIYVARERKVYALNASGKAPAAQTLARMNALGYQWDPKNWGPGSGMPGRGILSVTVPGSVWGWDEALRRFGTMTFKETLQPAIDYAEQGFPISERIAHDWRLTPAVTAVRGDARKCCTDVDPDSVATWYTNGRPPAAGHIQRNPGLARTFRLLQQQGRDGFYKGEVAKAIVAKSSGLGGLITLDDLADYSGEWSSPARTTYRGYDVFTLPPPAQTWATGEILNILEACVPTWAPGQTLATLGPANPQVPGTSSSKPRSWRSTISTRSTPTRRSRRCRSNGCCRSRTRSHCARASTPIEPPARRRAATSTAAATRSCSPPRTATATWSPGSTASIRALART